MIFGALIEGILQLVLHNTIALIEEVVYVKLNYLSIINFTKKNRLRRKKFVWGLEFCSVNYLSNYVLWRNYAFSSFFLKSIPAWPLCYLKVFVYSYVRYFRHVVEIHFRKVCPFCHISNMWRKIVNNFNFLNFRYVIKNYCYENTKDDAMFS